MERARLYAKELDIKGGASRSSARGGSFVIHTANCFKMVKKIQV